MLVYAPPYTGAPKMTISDAHEFPADVAGSCAGVVAITNICDARKCRLNTGNVVLYAKGSQKRIYRFLFGVQLHARHVRGVRQQGRALHRQRMNSGYQTSLRARHRRLRCHEHYEPRLRLYG